MDATELVCENQTEESVKQPPENVVDLIREVFLFDP